MAEYLWADFLSGVIKGGGNTNALYIILITGEYLAN